jgi:predicted transcriptional regulator
MSKEVLMSIMTKQADKIFEGTKQWEFRKALPRTEKDEDLSVVVYSSQKDKAIVGEFQAGRILRCSFEELMATTGYENDPEAVEWFKRYYKSGNTCSAIEVMDPQRYAKPLGLAAIKKAVPNFVPPQNFIYIHPGNQLATLIDQSKK